MTNVAIVGSEVASMGPVGEDQCSVFSRFFDGYFIIEYDDEFEKVGVCGIFFRVDDVEV